MENQKRKIVYIIPVLVISLLVSIDQLTKHIVDSTMKLGDSKTVIKNIFEISYIRNEGVAWGLFAGKRIIFLIMTCIIIAGCFYVYVNTYKIKKFLLLRMSLVVLVSGAIGNMIDRIKLGYVIDFFYFKPIDFPVFNVADIYVVVSMISIFLLILFKYTNEDFDEIFGVKKKDDK